MQFQVPQFIDTEDKIVGPFSLRQFAYVGVAGAIVGLLYFILQPVVWVILSVILLGSAMGIAFVKIQGRPLANVIYSAFNFYWKPQTYVWQPEHPAAQRAKTPEKTGSTLEKIAEGMALHKSWQKLQTGEKISNTQFVEKKMSGRYEIFARPLGDRRASKRVDYR